MIWKGSLVSLYYVYTFVVVQSLSRVRFFVTPWIAARQASLSFTISRSFAQTHWVSDAIQPSHLLLPPSPPALNLSQHQDLFQCASSSHQMAKVLQFQHQSFSWIFRVDFLENWLDWSPCWPKDTQDFSNSWKASILQNSVFFMVQLSHPYMTTGKTIALTVWTFVSKVMSLLFNTLCFLIRCLGLS